jgi:hypothetical protein
MDTGALAMFCIHQILNKDDTMWYHIESLIKNCTIHSASFDSCIKEESENLMRIFIDIIFRGVCPEDVLVNL